MATKRFFYFDYEKREAGYLNWRFPRSRRFDSALVYSTNCVISSVKKGKAYCFGGEYDTYSPTDGIFEINLESGEIRVVGHFGDLKVPDEWIRRAPPLSLGGDFSIGRVEGESRGEFLIGGILPKTGWSVGIDLSDLVGSEQSDVRVGPWKEMCCAEGNNGKIYCFGGWRWVAHLYAEISPYILEIDVSTVPDN